MPACCRAGSGAGPCVGLNDMAVVFDGSIMTRFFPDPVVVPFSGCCLQVVGCKGCARVVRMLKIVSDVPRDQRGEERYAKGMWRLGSGHRDDE